MKVISFLLKLAGVAGIIAGVILVIKAAMASDVCFGENELAVGFSMFFGGALILVGASLREDGGGGG